MIFFYFILRRINPKDISQFGNLKETTSTPAFSSSCYRCATFVLHAALPRLTQEPIGADMIHYTNPENTMHQKIW